MKQTKKILLSTLLCLALVLGLVPAMCLTTYASTTTTIYCRMTQSWWTSDGAAVGIFTSDDLGVAKASWPGERMTPVDGEEGLWSFELDLDTYHKCIFTRVNGSGNVMDYGAKTAELTIPTDGKNLFTITDETAVWGDPGCTGEWSTFSTSADLTPVTPDLTDDQKPAGKTGLVQTGSDLPLVEAPDDVPENYTVMYSIDNGTSWSAEVPTVKAAGTYTVKVKYVSGDEGYADFYGEDILVTVSGAPSGGNGGEGETAGKGENTTPSAPGNSGNSEEPVATKSGNKAGKVVLIVVIVLVVLAGAGAALYFFYFKKKKESAGEEKPEDKKDSQ